jgi:DNA-binding CsgD family transcriptional regulator
MGRGNAIGAVSALVRASELSSSDQDRARRLAEAACVGAGATGDLRDARTLLADARRADPEMAGSLPAACAAVYLMLNSDGDVDTAHRLFAGAIEAGSHGYRADDPALIDALTNLALVCYFGGRPELREPFYRSLERLTPGPPDLLALMRNTLADPARTGCSALADADRVLGTLPDEHDPTRILRIGNASLYIDRLGDVREHAWRLVDDVPAETATQRHLVGALLQLSLDDFLTGQWNEGEELADEGLAIFRTQGFPFYEWYFVYAKALFAAGRGRFAEATDLADDISRWAAPRRVRTAQLWAHHPRALVAHGQGDFDQALHHASQISPAGTLASHVPHTLWLMFDLVEAAMRCGRSADAQAHARAIETANVAPISSRMTLLQHACSALAASGDEARPRFDSALADVDSQRWRYEQARVRLAYGDGSATRSLTPARTQLHLARQAFEEMDARPWVERATAELRAAGERVQRITDRADSALTAQEREIAKLAATGLTNREIGERLYLSPRTVSTHLYRICPKLGINSRAALRDALDGIATARPSSS